MTEINKPAENKMIPEPVSETTPPKDALVCVGCNKETPRIGLSLIDGQPVCLTCEEKLNQELAAQKAEGPDIMTGLLGGVVAAIIAGIVWGLLVIATNYEIGYVAIGVGALTGYGVYLASGKKRGFSLQILASATSILGILVGKYIAFYHFFKQGVDEEAASRGFNAAEVLSTYRIFSFKMIGLFFKNISGWVNGYDILWVVLAVAAAYKIPKMLKLNIIAKAGKAENKK
jgi:hypothetical protein